MKPLNQQTAPISVSIDHEADAAYISLSNNPIVRTISVTQDVIIDLDEMNVAVGIEVLTLAAEIPLSRLVTDYHVHSQVADHLRLIQPSVAGFVSRVQVGSTNADLSQTSGQAATC